MSDVKKMDYSLLSGNVTENHTYRFKGWTYQNGVIKQLFKNYSHYIILGDTRSISTWLFLLLARCFCHNKKVCVWTHGWYGKEKTYERWLKHLFFKLPNGVIFTYGNYAKELMIKEGFPQDKILPIHNSLAYDKQITIRSQLTEADVYRCHFGNSNPNLFFVGRLTAVKNLDQILYAMHKSNIRGYKYNLTLIGGGEKYNELQKISKELDLENQVWFYGPCYDEIELSTLIYNADLCVAPGNIGLTAMHSLVFGTPAITHNDYKWQMPEFEAIREGVTGTFFEKDNVEDLSNKIDDWLNSHSHDRVTIRQACMDEIDRGWNPYYQLDILKKGLNNE